MDYPTFEEELIERLEWISKELHNIHESLAEYGPKSCPNKFDIFSDSCKNCLYKYRCINEE